MGLEQLLHQALSAQQRGNQAEAERLYRQVLAAAPEEFNANHLLGILFFQQGRSAEALSFLEKALKANPEVAEAHAHYGLILHGLGRDGDALKSLDKALAIQPQLVEALNSRGMVLKALGQPAQALASLEAALALEPEYSQAWNNRGIALRDLGRGEEALASFERAAVLEPGNIEIQFNRGQTCRDLGHCREAALAFENVLAVCPDHPAALNSLALVLCECDRAEEAMHHFQRHAALTSRTPASARTSGHKLNHDLEQQDYLNARGADTSLRQVGARLASGAVNRSNNIASIAQQWRDARPQVVVIDDLLTNEALDELRLFCWRAPVWQKVYDNGYLGAMPEQGFACPLLAQIAQEMRQTYAAIIGQHQLRYFWAFKCDSRLKGINIHADFAAVNVNFWLTPDEANLDPQSGGLIVWDVAAPLGWDFSRYNNDEAAIRNFLMDRGARSMTIPYRANRAVIFDSDLFHQTDNIAFKDGYTNRRINVTALFGRRRTHEGLVKSTA
jgi:Tfp pilus assembly protein PilF